jgi:hypothetical protein
VSEEANGEKRVLRVAQDDNGVKWMLALYLVAVAVATVQRGILGIENNFAIFRWAFVHLQHGQDLYAFYPGQHDDQFKYSPTFAVLFAPFALWPFAIGLTLWNATSAVAVWYAVTKLLPPRQAVWALGLAFIEVLTCLQRAQSNALCAAVIILAFIALERGQLWRASIAIATGAFVKIFPLAALAFALWQRRIIRFAFVFVAVMAGFVALPLAVTSPTRLIEQYASWRATEAHDADELEHDCVQCAAKVDGGGLYGGVMQQLRFWTGAPVPNWPVQLAGTILLLLPIVLRWRDRDDPAFRRLVLCSLLVYVVIFNHQSESPSFVIAMLGVTIWWASSARTRWQTTCLVLTVLIVSIAYSDIVPGQIRSEVFGRYRLKTVPCLLAWLAMQWELWRGAPALPSPAPPPAASLAA